MSSPSSRMLRPTLTYVLSPPRLKPLIVVRLRVFLLRLSTLPTSRSTRHRSSAAALTVLTVASTVRFRLVALAFLTLPAYMSSPCHIEMIFEEKDVPVPKAKDASAPAKKKVSKKKEAKEKAVQRTQE